MGGKTRAVRRAAAQQSAAAAAVDSQEAEASQAPLLDIPEAEQWRIINETGVLHKLKESDTEKQMRDTEGTTLADELFNALLYTIPFSSLLLLMEILINQQYSREPTIQNYLDRMLPSVPIIFLACFYTLRHKASRYTQVFLFWAGVIIGGRLIWTVNKAPWRVNLAQNPPLATAWVFTIVQLDLLYAVFSLLLIGAYTWFTGLSLTP